MVHVDSKPRPRKAYHVFLTSFPHLQVKEKKLRTKREVITVDVGGKVGLINASVEQTGAPPSITDPY